MLQKLQYIYLNLNTQISKELKSHLMYEIKIATETESIALSKHKIDNGHCFNLYNENNYRRTQFLKIIHKNHIKRNPSINFKPDI